MSLPVPQLDTLTFEELIDDARALIPRYAREWTDHNVHDPGITLLELVAWLVDQQIYQVGFVGNRHLAAFAGLLGVRPEDAKPARGIVWPSASDFGDDPAVTGVDVPQGAEVSCVEQPDVPFELAGEMHVTPARLHTPDVAEAEASVTDERFQITAQTTGRRAALPLGESAGTPGAVELVFDRPLVERPPGGTASLIALGVELEGRGGARAALGGRLLADYRLGDGAWRRVEVVDDGTLALNRTGVVRMNIAPSPHVANGSKLQSRLRLQTRDRVNPHPPRIAHAAVNALPIIQVETQESAVLGRGSGLPDQSFELPLKGIIRRSDVRIEVEKDGAFDPWSAVEDLSREGPDASVFEVRWDADAVVFGNGVNGRIPPSGVQIRHLGYAVTLGDAGNLATWLTWDVRGAPRRADDGAYGENRAPLRGGADAWDIDNLREAARRRAVERRALLTNEQLVDAVTRLEGLAIARSEVRVGFHPALPAENVPGARAVFVTPERPEDIDALQPVSARYVAAVEYALRPHRVLGERLSVLALDRFPLRVEALLLVEDGLDPEPIIAAAKARLDARLSDVRVQPDVEPWPAGRTVTTGEMQTLLVGVSGVIAVKSCRIARGTDLFGEADVPLSPDETAIGHEHDIRWEVIKERRS